MANEVAAFVFIPPQLRDTPLGEFLTARMLTASWVMPPWHTMDPEFQELALRGCSKQYLFHMQKVLGLKRTPHPTEPVCAGCNMALVEYKKCSTCLVARYCSERCQQTHWPTHKAVCNPCEPRVLGSVILCMPDYQCFWNYMNWMTHQLPTDEALFGVTIMNRDVFNQTFDEIMCKKTILSLALHGHPLVLMNFSAYERLEPV